MKVNELSKQLNVKNKELIDFLKSKGYVVTSHMQTVTDEMYDDAVNFFEISETDGNEDIDEDNNEPEIKNTNNKNIVERKVFSPDDLIPCKSVSPFKLNTVGLSKRVYHWNYFGDIDYIEYRDLQAMRRKDIITKPKILIEDPDLCIQWARDLGDVYKYYLGVDYPEDFFEKTDGKFEEMLQKAPNTLKDVIKITAMNMINNENYPTVQKITIIDRVLGTCLKDFL